MLISPVVGAAGTRFETPQLNAHKQHARYRRIAFSEPDSRGVSTSIAETGGAEAGWQQEAGTTFALGCMDSLGSAADPA
jgi:hypothetical protein